MMKRLPLLLSFLLLAGFSTAQQLRLGGTLRPQRQTSVLHAPWERYARPHHPLARRQAIEVGDNQLWWGYYKGGGKLQGLGTSRAETYYVATAIPPTEPLPRNKNILGVRFVVAGTAQMQNFKVWLSESLLTDARPASVTLDVDMKDVVDNGWTEVALPEPYPIPSKTLYVGYTFDITEAGAEGMASNYPVLIDYDGTDIPGAIWVRTSEGVPSWTDPADTNSGYGKLALQVLLEGDFPHDAVELGSSFNDVFALSNGTAEATLTLFCRGLHRVESIDYVVTTGDVAGEEHHLTLEKPLEGMDAETTIRIPLMADAEPGRTLRTVTVTKVNGIENEALAIAEGYFVTLSKAVPRRTVVEEFTGTWCGWCPMGIVGMQKINEQMSDRAITIIIHGDDPMEISYGVSAPSYPYALVDRSTPAHPYYGRSDAPLGILTLVDEMNQTLSEAEVSLQQPVLNKNGTISLKTDVTFGYSTRKSNYAMGYVLMADSLSGSGRKWAQANYFCQEDNREEYANDANLSEWVNGKSYMPMVYNRVPIAAKGMANGVSGSIAAPIVEGATRTVSSSFNLAGNVVMQDFDHLSVVAVLFNTETGSIVNADIRPVLVSEDFAQNKVQLKNFEQASVVKGNVAKVNVPVANFGRAGIRSLDYVVRAGGVCSDTLHLDIEQPVTTFGVYQNIAFDVPAQPETGVLNHVIALTKVNGVENEATTGKTASGSLVTLTRQVPRRVVIEEYTGTWCGWCPRGLQGLKRARQEYPDQTVMMSIHSGSSSAQDPMQVSAFSTLISGHAFPSAEVNRYRSVDPYMGEASDGWGLGDVIEDEQRHLAEAAVELQQPILDETTGVISFTTDITFLLNRTSAPYLMAYVLVADGLTGTGTGWAQTNYYAYFAGMYDEDPFLKEITEWPMTVENIAFDDVAVAANGIATGIAGSLKTVVQEEQVVSHSSKFGIKSNALARQASELRVLALLYDKNAKRFVNADQKKVLTAEEAAVHDVNSSADAREMMRYGVDGKRLTRPVRGIHLVRMSDGSVKKILY